MAITVINVSVTTTPYTVPSGKYGKFIVNYAQLDHGRWIYIGDYQAYNGCGATVGTKFVGHDASNTNATYAPSAQYLTLQEAKHAYYNVVGLIREHILIAGQTIYTSVGTSYVKGTLILQDV
jgi:hypothetical protein